MIASGSARQTNGCVSARNVGSGSIPMMFWIRLAWFSKENQSHGRPVPPVQPDPARIVHRKRVGGCRHDHRPRQGVRSEPNMSAVWCAVRPDPQPICPDSARPAVFGTQGQALCLDAAFRVRRRSLSPKDFCGALWRRCRASPRATDCAVPMESSSPPPLRGRSNREAVRVGGDVRVEKLPPTRRVSAPTRCAAPASPSRGEASVFFPNLSTGSSPTASSAPASTSQARAARGSVLLGSAMTAAYVTEALCATASVDPAARLAA